MNSIFNWPVKRTLTTIFALLFLVFAVFGAYLLFQNTQHQNHQASQILHKDLAQHVVDEYLLVNQGKIDMDSAKRLFTELMILGPNFEFYVLDTDGYMVTCSIPPEDILNKDLNTKPIQEFLQAKTDVTQTNQTHKHTSQFPIYGDNPINPDQKALFSAAPIYDQDVLTGYLYVIFGSQEHKNLHSILLDANQNQYLLIGVSLLILFIFCIGITVSQLVLKPLSRLSRQVHQDAFIQFQEDQELIQQPLTTWQKNSANEFHQLGNAFHGAYTTLTDQCKLLAANEKSRKELLAHLSHDIRTPMASLLGFLETYLLHEKTLNNEEKIKYIETAKRSAEKVHRLTEQLFELAYLDSHKVSMQMEPFPIAELIQDILNNLKVKADQQKVTLELTPKDSSILVYGDIEKLDRVINNLVENAIRHTQENGKVLVAIRKKDGEVIVSIVDNGLGIPAEDIPYIFDAHYKGQNSVRENTAHGGLGLAITKRLLELHNSEINVDSILNKGTRFDFNLPQPSTVV